MKKIITLLFVSFMLFSLGACSAGNEQDTDVQDPSDPVVVPGEDEGIPAEVKEPSVNWWTIKTNTGIPTFVAELKNTNDAAVDLVFTVDYFLGGEKIQSREDLFVNALAAGTETMVFDTWDIPEAADDIQVTFTYLAESVYEPVDVNIVGEEVVGNDLKITCSAAEDFEQLDIYSAYFSNNDLVAIGFNSFFAGEKPECTVEVLENYDTYKIYVQAYKLK